MFWLVAAGLGPVAFLVAGLAAVSPPGDPSATTKVVNTFVVAASATLAIYLAGWWM